MATTKPLTAGTKPLVQSTIVCCLLFAAGCAATYKRSDLAAAPSKLDRSQAVLIATPVDGLYGGEQIVGSGLSTSLAVRAAFAKFAKATSVASDCRDLSCLTRQAQAKPGYYVVPKILHWEERAAEWAGKPDRMEIRISVYDAQNMNEVAATILSGKSKRATFGGNHPEDLLPDPLGEYVGSLY